jgi:hypothetical protein
MHKAAAATMIEAEKPRSDELTEVYTPNLSAGAGSLPSAVERMLGLIDGARTLEEVCGLCGLQPQRGVAVARKLEALGMIRCGHGAAFSELEEEFFATEVPPDEEPLPEPWSHRLLHRLLQKRPMVDLKSR